MQTCSDEPTHERRDGDRRMPKDEERDRRPRRGRFIAGAQDDRAEATGRILTVAELAKYLRVHPATVYRLLKNGTLPGFRVGSDWRFRAEDVDLWLRKSQTKKQPRGTSFD